MVEFNTLVGRTIAAIKVDDGEDAVTFSCTDGDRFRMYHSQSCCENVRLSDVVGDLDDLIGSPILLAEEVTHLNEDPPEVTVSEEDARYRESWTWTFYKLATIKGSVTLRWLGESNGYYSESVDFDLVEP